MENKTHYKRKETPAADPFDYYYGSSAEPVNKFLTIRLTADQLTHLNALCEKLKTSKSAFIKRLIFSLIPGGHGQ